MTTNDSTTETPSGGPTQRKLWVRALLMLLLAVAFQLAIWLLGAVAVLQLILVAVSDGPNGRLRSFGGSVGRYLMQIADFVTFRTEELPFPFSDWPASQEGPLVKP